MTRNDGNRGIRLLAAATSLLPVVFHLAEALPADLGNVPRPRITGGCWARSSDQQMMGGRRTLSVDDPRLGAVLREVEVYVPTRMPSRASTTPWAATGAPLLLGFHGQSGSPWEWSPREHFKGLAEEQSWVFAMPAGLRENGDRKAGDSSWNVGAAGDEDTCSHGTTNVNCMASCQRLDLCGRCNWSTCYDDVAFVKILIDLLERELCLDPQRYFVVGESNGGMLTHGLVKELPGTFQAAASVFGSPLLGYLNGAGEELLLQADALRRTSFLQVHDRGDNLIPGDGGRCKDGWIYEPMVKALRAWAAVHGCGFDRQPMKTNYGGGPKNVVCHEFANCSRGGRVAYCWYDGRHGVWPDQPRAVSLVWEFFNSVSPKSEEVYLLT